MVLILIDTQIVHIIHQEHTKLYEESVVQISIFAGLEDWVEAKDKISKSTKISIFL